uniref:Uncharacterized protein n=1 Tax=Timema cristinae TaxID=61476 RepID=A0A7R9H0Q7_TIMCR|nr:unnamed protein product [Timema cristinae]
MIYESTEMAEDIAAVLEKQFKPNDEPQDHDFNRDVTRTVRDYLERPNDTRTEFYDQTETHENELVRGLGQYDPTEPRHHKQPRKAREYIRRLVSYVDQYRDYVLTATSSNVAPCKPVWDVFHAMRLLFCRHIMDPLNGFWFSMVWCLVLLTVATPVSLKLVRHYKQMKHDGLLHSRSSE